MGDRRSSPLPPGKSTPVSGATVAYNCGQIPLLWACTCGDLGLGAGGSGGPATGDPPLWASPASSWPLWQLLGGATNSGGGLAQSQQQVQVTVRGQPPWAHCRGPPPPPPGHYGGEFRIVLYMAFLVLHTTRNSWPDLKFYSESCSLFRPPGALCAFPPDYQPTGHMTSNALFQCQKHFVLFCLSTFSILFSVILQKAAKANRTYICSNKHDLKPTPIKKQFSNMQICYSLIQM